MIDLTVGESAGAAGKRVFSETATAHDRSLRLVPLVDLDLASEVEARSELTQACETAGSYHWVVVAGPPDWFVDVRGLAVLLDGASEATARGRELVVVDPPRSLRQSVAALSLDTELRLVTDLSELDG